MLGSLAVSPGLLDTGLGQNTRQFAFLSGGSPPVSNQNAISGLGVIRSEGSNEAKRPMTSASRIVHETDFKECGLREKCIKPASKIQALSQRSSRRKLSSVLARESTLPVSFSTCV
jgi:hypothetical protein